PLRQTGIRKVSVGYVKRYERRQRSIRRQPEYGAIIERPAVEGSAVEIAVPGLQQRAVWSRSIVYAIEGIQRSKHSGRCKPKRSAIVIGSAALRGGVEITIATLS